MDLGREGTPRWQYRLESFGRAVMLLGQAVELMRSRDLSMLETEGMVRRFTVAWELGWTLLADHLEHSGQVLPTLTPAAIVRAALAAKLVEDGEVWMQMLDERTRVANTGNAARFDMAADQIRDRYFPALEALYRGMTKRALADGAEGT